MRECGLVLLVMGLLATAACTKDNPPPVLNPGARAIVYTDGTQMYSVCDKGNLIYLSKKGFQIIPAGCPDGQP